MKPRDTELAIYFPPKYQKQSGLLNFEFKIDGAMQVHQRAFYKDDLLLVAVEFPTVEARDAFVASYEVPEGVKVVWRT